MQQLRLFDHPKPLLDRLGADFFRKAPARPGVYIMANENGRVLYIGQSRNLRQRLHTYKNANPEHLARKIVRLVHQVHSIVWEECESAEAARLRENELLRTHRPTFNKVNTYPRAYCFIALKRESSQLELALMRELQAEGQQFGAFKAHASSGYGALLRLLWRKLNRAEGLEGFPPGLLTGRAPRRWCFELKEASSDLSDLIGSYLEGTSNALVRALGNGVDQTALHPFCRQFWNSDFETLEQFYQLGPERNYHLRRMAKIEGTVIAQEELDDLLIWIRERQIDLDPLQPN